MIRDAFGTEHANLRLMQRARQFDRTLTELWEDGIECEVSHHGYDEARVSPEYDLVLLKEDGRIVTLIPETYNVTVEGDDFEEFMDSALEGQE